VDPLLLATEDPFNRVGQVHPLRKGVNIMGERVVTLGASRATRPITDFLMVEDYQGPKAGTYYVDLNVAATGKGSPDHPFATIAEAITASNASIGLAANRWWARRNRIFVCGDGITENLTILPCIPSRESSGIMRLL
jgi:hypothetical protein